MLKPTETLKTFQVFWNKLQKFQVFGENCQNFKVFGKISSSEKIAKNFKIFETNCKFLERTAKISRFWLVFCCF